jgi:hypothetical protein
VRRRPRERTGPGAPPPELTTFTGTSNRDKLAWLRARDDWWEQIHPMADDPDQVGSLQWVIDGHDQVGDFHWCGSVGAPCDDPDCLCTVWIA